MKAGNSAGDSGTFPSATHQAMPDPTNTNLERDASSIEMSDLKDDCMTNLASKFTLTHLEDAEEGRLTPISESRHPSSRPPSKLELHIADWATLKKAKSSVVSGLQTVVEILDVFIDVALANKLDESPAVEILRKAKGTAEKAQKLLPSESSFPDLAMNDRIAERVISPASFNFRYRDDVVKGVPLWNMFDALTYIYSACVADIFTTRDCELYLYQLRTIFGILGTAVGGYFGFTVPSTVAATWREVKGGPFLVGFAASCTGNDKRTMANVRRKYVDALVNLMPADNKRALNASGNCPEFITWSIICRNAGKYQSLCLNNFKDFAYKFCGHCEDASVAFSKKQYEIEDLFNGSSLLSSTKIMNQNTYPGCKLKSVEAIIKDGRGKRKRTEGTDEVEETEKTKKKKTERIKVDGRVTKRTRK